MGVEAAVGPHRELSPGPAVAHPPHRLTQEVGGATGGVGPALAQPGHQHLAGAGGNGQQRVIAAGAGIAVVARSLLGQSIGLADGRVQVDGQGRVAGSGPSGLRPGPTTGGSRGRVDGHAPTGIKHEFNLTPFLQATNIIPNNKGDYIFLGQSIGLETVHQDFCHYVLADKLMHEDQASVC